MLRSSSPQAIVALVILALCMILPGCSSSGIPGEPVFPDSINNPANGGGRGLLGIYTWDYDREQGTIDALPLREAEAHYNVTWYIDPPQCNDCLKVEILGFTPKPHDMWVAVTLKNPTQLAAKDVRGIILDENEEIYLMNPYAATPLWDWHSPKWHNDFHPFMAYDSERTFGPGENDTVTYRLRLPETGVDLSGIRYIVDASWLKHCGEPYGFLDVAKTGTLGTSPTKEITLTCQLLDWQLDYAAVQLDLTPLGYPSWVWMDYNPNTFWYAVANTYSAPEGKYSIRFTAYDQVVPEVISYDLDVYVSDDHFPPQWQGPLQGLAEATPGDRSVTLVYGYAMDLPSPPVTYHLFYDDTGPYDFEDQKIMSDIGPTPKTIRGLRNGVLHMFIVRAMDSSGNFEMNQVIRACTPND